MNKGELVSAIHCKLKGSFTKKDIEEILNASTKVIVETVANGEKVSLVGFGAYEKVYREARTGRNPQTGEPMEIEAKYVPKFDPGKQFKGAVALGKELSPV